MVDPDGDDDGMLDAWETAMLGGTSQSGTDDADNDGVLSLAEFAFNGDPKSSSSSMGGVTSPVQASYLTVTVPFLTGATFGDGSNGTQTAIMGGITYIIRGSFDLQNFNSPVEFVSKTASGDPDYELHTFRLPASLNFPDKGFLQAFVSTP